MTCECDKCREIAVWRVFWPERPPASMCEACKCCAVTISEAMGFSLHHESMEGSAPSDPHSP